MFELRHTKTRTGSGLARLQHERAHEHFTPRSCALSTPGEPAGQSTKDWAAPLLMPIRAREDFKPQSHGCGLTRFPGALRRHQSESMSRATSSSSSAGFLRLLCSASTSTNFCKVGAELSRITRSLDFGFYLRTCMSSADFSSCLFCYY